MTSFKNVVNIRVHVHRNERVKKLIIFDGVFNIIRTYVFCLSDYGNKYLYSNSKIIMQYIITC